MFINRYNNVMIRITGVKYLVRGRPSHLVGLR